MTHLEYDSSLKALRETLCIAQSLQVFLPMNASPPQYIASLQNLIDEIDKHRPLGPDGKHGNRHTKNCGCEDLSVVKDIGHHGPWCDHHDCPNCFRGYNRHRKCLLCGHDWSIPELREATAYNNHHAGGLS